MDTIKKFADYYDDSSSEEENDVYDKLILENIYRQKAINDFNARAKVDMVTDLHIGLSFFLHKCAEKILTSPKVNTFYYNYLKTTYLKNNLPILSVNQFVQFINKFAEEKGVGEKIRDSLLELFKLNPKKFINYLNKKKLVKIFEKIDLDFYIDWKILKLKQQVIDFVQKNEVVSSNDIFCESLLEENILVKILSFLKKDFKAKRLEKEQLLEKLSKENIDIKEFRQEALKSIIIKFEEYCEQNENFMQSPIQRKTLVNNFVFDYTSLDHSNDYEYSTVKFLSNLRLINRSSKRVIKNLKQCTELQYQSITIKHKYQFLNSVFQIEEDNTMDISTGRQAYTDKTNIGAYLDKAKSAINEDGAKKKNKNKSIQNVLRNIVEKENIEGANIASNILNILKTGAVKQDFKVTNEKYIYGLTALWFGCEASRNPASLLTNAMYLDLVINNKYDIVNNLDKMPMHISGAVEGNRGINFNFRDYLSNNLHYDYNLPDVEEGFLKARRLIISEKKIFSDWAELQNKLLENEGKATINPGDTNAVIKILTEAIERWYGIDLSHLNSHEIANQKDEDISEEKIEQKSIPVNANNKQEDVVMSSDTPEEPEDDLYKLKEQFQELYISFTNNRNELSIHEIQSKLTELQVGFSNYNKTGRTDGEAHEIDTRVNAFNQRDKEDYYYQTSDISAIQSKLMESYENDFVIYKPIGGYESVKDKGSSENDRNFKKNLEDTLRDVIETVTYEKPVLAVYNTGHLHWVSIAFLKRGNNVIVLYKNSTGHDGDNTLKSAIKNVTKDKELTFNWSYNSLKEQTDGVDCGIFALQNIKIIADNIRTDKEAFIHGFATSSIFRSLENAQHLRKDGFAKLYVEGTYKQIKVEKENAIISTKIREYHQPELEQLSEYINNVLSEQNITIKIIKNHEVFNNKESNVLGVEIGTNIEDGKYSYYYKVEFSYGLEVESIKNSIVNGLNLIGEQCNFEPQRSILTIYPNAVFTAKQYLSLEDTSNESVVVIQELLDNLNIQESDIKSQELVGEIFSEINNPVGSGLEQYEQSSYWYEYSNYAILRNLQKNWKMIL